MIELKTLNKKQLLALINSENYAEMPVLPISKHRALSHIHNPRANEDDVLLILAYEGESLLGYLGVLPDDIYKNTGEKYHAGWLSCIWVSPLARGKGIAKKMVLKAYELYKKHLLITNFTKDAGLLYNRLGVFVDLPDLKGIRFYRKMCLAKVMPLRYPKLAHIKFIFTWVDTVFNIFWTLFLKTSKMNLIKSDTLPSEDYSLNSNITNVPIGFKRTKSEFEWIEQYPWIKEVTNFSNEAKKYYFSSEEKQFKTSFIKVESNNGTVGYIKYSLRNGHLKVPYILYDLLEPNFYADKISELIIQSNASYVTLFLPQEIFKKIDFKYIYKKSIVRHFKISNELAQKLQDKTSMVIFDGDGDAVFT